MLIESDAHSHALQLLRSALQMCLDVLDAEIDPVRIEALTTVIGHIEAAVTMLEGHRRAIPLRR